MAMAVVFTLSILPPESRRRAQNLVPMQDRAKNRQDRESPAAFHFGTVEL
jgi:hypothetical protein